jgi:Fe-S-cluster containining protein
MQLELLVDRDVIECSCARCQAACDKKPGWFLPGEAERAAALLGLTLKEMFDQYLTVDFWGKTDRFVLSPATTRSPRGAEADFIAVGRCVFLTDEGLCRIHAAKPFECRQFDHRKKEPPHGQHEAVAISWTTPEAKAQIRELLGREPHVEMTPAAARATLAAADDMTIVMYALDCDNRGHAAAILNLLPLHRRVKLKLTYELARAMLSRGLL